MQTHEQFLTHIFKLAVFYRFNCLWLVFVYFLLVFVRVSTLQLRYDIIVNVVMASCCLTKTDDCIQQERKLLTQKVC